MTDYICPFSAQLCSLVNTKVLRKYSEALGWWAGRKTVGGWNMLLTRNWYLSIWTSPRNVYFLKDSLHSAQECLASTVNRLSSSPVLKCWSNSCSLASTFSHPQSKQALVFKGLLEEGHYFHSDSKPAVRALSTVSLCFLCSTLFYLWHACNGRSAFPEMAITIKSISWKPECFPNCLKSQCEKEVSIDWNMRGNNPKFIILFLFYKHRWDGHTQESSDLLFWKPSFTTWSLWSGFLCAQSLFLLLLLFLFIYLFIADYFQFFSSGLSYEPCIFSLSSNVLLIFSYF